MKTDQTLLMLKYGYNQALKYVEQLIEVTENCGYTNEQAFINFEDKLNELSIKDHNNESN